MIFEYRCAKCGHEQEELRTLAQRNDDLACEACGGPSERKLSVPRVFLPRWMRDENWAGARRHSEYLKTDKAKKLDMEHSIE
jgi:putative FmdB family regulatory protein